MTSALVWLTPAFASAAFCPGDCNLDGRVSIGELQRSVRISLGITRMNDCKAIDLNADTLAGVEELIAAVDAALWECSSAAERFFECPWPDIADGVIHAFVMAGQSNMRGVGIPDELPDDLRRGDPRLVMYGDSWVTLKPGPHWFGPEIGFARTIADACPNSRIGVLKHTRVATGINSWLRDWDEELAKLVGNPDTGPLYPELIERIDAAERRGAVEWEGFVWIHGTSDKGRLELANAYGANMALLAEAIRDELANPELPFLFHYSLLNPPATGAALNGVVFEIAVGDKIVELEKWRAQFEIPDAYAANWARIATRDLVHLTSEGYLIGGRLVAEALLSGSAAPAEE